MPIMKTEPQPSDREVLAGLLERVTYQNADNGFCVIRVKARGHRDLVTVVGHAAVISAGEDERPHPRPAVQGSFPQDICPYICRRSQLQNSPVTIWIAAAHDSQ
jgi:hypothetical protein